MLQTQNDPLQRTKTRLDEHSNHRNVQNQAVHCYNNTQFVHLTNCLSPSVPRCPKVCAAQPVGHTGWTAQPVAHMNSWDELQLESTPPAFQIPHASHCSQASISLPMCRTPNSLFNAQARAALPVYQTMNMPYNFFDQTELTTQKSVDTSYRKQVHSVPTYFKQTRSTPHRAQVQTTLPFQQTSFMLNTSAASAANQIIDTSLNFRPQNAVPGFQTSSTSITEIVWQPQATPLAYQNTNFLYSRQIQSASYDSQMKNSPSDIGAQMLGTNHLLLRDNRNLNTLAFHVENKGLQISPSNPFNSNRSSTDKLFGANVSPELSGKFQFPAPYQLNPIAQISSQHYQPTSIYYTHTTLSYCQAQLSSYISQTNYAPHSNSHQMKLLQPDLSPFFVSTTSIQENCGLSQPFCEAFNASYYSKFSNDSQTQTVQEASGLPFKNFIQTSAKYNPFSMQSSSKAGTKQRITTTSHQQPKDYWVQKEQFLDQRNVETGNAFPIHQSQQQQIDVTSSNVGNSPHRLVQHPHSVAQSNTFDSNNRHLPHYPAYLKQNVSLKDQAISSEFSRRQQQKSANCNKQSISKQTRVCQDKTSQALAEVQTERCDSNDERDDSCERNVTYNIYCGPVDKSSKKTVFGDNTQIGGTRPTSKNYCK